ncbi:hypothetical protein V6N11_070654 [Hibiscus sabdariffa]|uniref:Uncharacterized protein n=1 Tax=Hibiscus sabdariffa TaxID=183260 RepID=A0ABR2QFN7_9ROSI
MKHEHNETTSSLRGHINSLMAEMNYKDCILRNWEVRYNGTKHCDARKEETANLIARSSANIGVPGTT